MANVGQDVTSYRMIESAFRHHVTVSVAKMPSRPVLTVVVLTRALDAHRGDFYDPTATVDRAVLCTDWSDSVETSRNILEPSQVVHLDGRWCNQGSLSWA